MAVVCETAMRFARAAARDELDRLSDIVIEGNELRLRRELMVIEAQEVYVQMPQRIVDCLRGLFTKEIVGSVAQMVHDNVIIEIGCSRVPLFSLVSGGCGRTLFTFRCVYQCCPAFLEIRLFSGVYSIKWIMTSNSHCHGFDVFPERMPRSTFSQETLCRFQRMINENQPCAEIKIQNEVLCTKNTYQNATRRFRAEKNTEQARELRDVAGSSSLWHTEVCLSKECVFIEAYFANSELLSKGVSCDFTFVDDTSCTNSFSFPVVAVLCRCDSGLVHCMGHHC